MVSKYEYKIERLALPESLSVKMNQLGNVGWKFIQEIQGALLLFEREEVKVDHRFIDEFAYQLTGTGTKIEFKDDYMVATFEGKNFDIDVAFYFDEFGNLIKTETRIRSKK